MTSVTLASRTVRLIGQIADDVAAFAPMFALGIFANVDEAAGRVLIIPGLLWAGFYLLMSDGFGDGQSWGKYLVGIRVVDATSKAPCTFGQSVGRNILLWLLGPIDWIFIFGGRRQRLGDKAAGTIVIVE